MEQAYAVMSKQTLLSAVHSNTHNNTTNVKEKFGMRRQA